MADHATQPRDEVMRDVSAPPPAADLSLAPPLTSTSPMDVVDSPAVVVSLPSSSSLPPPLSSLPKPVVTSIGNGNEPHTATTTTATNNPPVSDSLPMNGNVTVTPLPPPPTETSSTIVSPVPDNTASTTAAIAPPPPPPSGVAAPPPPNTAIVTQPPAPPESWRARALARANRRKLFFPTLEDALMVVMETEFLDVHDLISFGCTNKQWRLKTRTLRRWRRLILNLDATLTGHIGRITAIAGVDGYVFTASVDGKFKAWDSRTWLCSKSMNVTPNPVLKYIHPRFRHNPPFASASPYPRQPNLGITAEYIASDGYPEHTLAVTALTAYKNVLFVGLEDGRLTVWQIAQKEDMDLQIHEGAIMSIIVTETHVYTCSSDKAVKCIARNLLTKQDYGQQQSGMNSIYKGVKHTQPVCALAYCAGSNPQQGTGRLFSGDFSGSIVVWQPEHMEYKCELLDRERGRHHKERITAMCSTRSTLYTASMDCTIKMWHSETLQLLRDVAVMPVGICWSMSYRVETDRFSGIPPVQTIVCGVRDNDICIYNAHTLEVLSSMDQDDWAYKSEQHKHWVRAIYAMPDGRIVTGSDDWTCKVWQYRGSAKPNKVTLRGLPPGPLCEEDLEIMAWELRGQVSPPNITVLQDGKKKHDAHRAKKMEEFNAPEKAAFLVEENAFRETWKVKRENHKLEKAKNPEFIKALMKAAGWTPEAAIALAAQLAQEGRGDGSSSSTTATTTTTTTTTSSSDGGGASVVAAGGGVPTATDVTTSTTTSEPTLAPHTSQNGSGASDTSMVAPPAASSSDNPPIIPDGGTNEKKPAASLPVTDMIDTKEASSAAAAPVVTVVENVVPVSSKEVPAMEAVTIGSGSGSSSGGGGTGTTEQMMNGMVEGHKDVVMTVLPPPADTIVDGSIRTKSPSTSSHGEAPPEETSLAAQRPRRGVQTKKDSGEDGEMNKSTASLESGGKTTRAAASKRDEITATVAAATQEPDPKRPRRRS